MGTWPPTSSPPQFQGGHRSEARASAGGSPVFVQRGGFHRDHRWHGDPVPLPWCNQRSSRSRWSRRLCKGDASLESRMGEAVRSLNFLSRSSFAGDRGAYYGTPAGIPSATQRACLSSLASRISAYGARPEGMTPDACLREVTQAKGLYDQMPANLAPFDIRKLRVAKGQVNPKPAASLLPPEVAEMLRTWRTTILRVRRSWRPTA